VALSCNPATGGPEQGMGRGGGLDKLWWCWHHSSWWRRETPGLWRDEQL
jgi:hypothetical protein